MSFSDWEECKLGDVCTLGDGAHTKVERLKSGIPYLTSKNIKNGYINLENIDFISEEDNHRLFGESQKSVRHLQENDLLVGIIGTLGNSYMYKKSDNFGISSSIAILRPNPTLLYPKYLYYIVNSKNFLSLIQKFKGGSVQAYTNLPTLRAVPINLPLLGEQKFIANILSSLDKKIETNNQINKRLDELSKAIFKQWFIDFEFPNEEGLPYKSSGGEMFNSELGMIPKGWEVKTIKDITYNFDSKRKPLSSREREEKKGCYPYYGATSIIDYVENYIFDGIYILLGEDGTVINDDGTPVLQYIWKKAWVNNHAHVLQGNGISSELLYLYLKAQNVRNIVTGAVQLKINQANLNSVKVVLADQKIIMQFEGLIKGVFAKIRNLADENNNLTNLRDTLLPKLMNGEIDLTNLEINI